MQKESKYKSRLVSYFIILIFLGPVLAAYIIYACRDHLNLKTQNNGLLISPPILGDSLNLPSIQGFWQLIYLKPLNCHQDCQAFEQTVKAIYTALGKNQHRVKLNIFPAKNTHHFIKDGVVIIDPKGFLMMYYPSPISNPKGILDDIRILLRNSHDR